MGAILVFAMGVLIGVFVVVLVLAPCVLSSQISQEEEEREGNG